MFFLLIKLMILDVVNFSILFFIYWEINNLLRFVDLSLYIYVIIIIFFCINYFLI